MEKIQVNISELQKEKEQFVFGAVLAIVTGLLVSIWGNIIYGRFFLIEKAALDILPVSFLLFTTIQVEAFFEFYLKDKYSDGPYTSTFWKRYIDFTFDKHWYGVISLKITNGAIFILKFFLWTLFIISATQAKAYILLVMVLLFIVLKNIYYKFSDRIKEMSESLLKIIKLESKK